MSRHSNEELSEALDQIDMEDYLSSQGIDYKVTPGTSGVQLNVRECPRCGGTGWKVYLNMDTGYGNCFHGACADEPGFNKFSFINHLLGGNARTTATHVQEYARQVGWQPVRKTAVMTVNNEVKLPDHYELPVVTPRGEGMPEYLARRGVTAQIAKYFGLLYCVEGGFKYTDHNGKDCVQDYSNRILIPIYNLDGELKTFQGRDITGTADKKYLFPPGLAGSGRYLYNAHNCVGMEEVIMNEGAFDVIATKMAFDHDMNLRRVGQIGSFGKSLSELSDGDNQTTMLMEMKAHGLKTITMMWDGEPKTIIDSINVGLRLKSLGFRVKIAVLPLMKDPAECSAQEVRECYYRARPLDMTTAMLMTMNMQKLQAKLDKATRSITI